MSEGKRILILASDDDFFAGYQQGYLTYGSEQKSKPISDDTIYQVVITKLIDTTHSDRYNTGFVAGWFAALYNKSYVMELPQPSAVAVKGGGYE